MRKFQKLETEKYVHKAMKKEVRVWKRARNAKALRDFTTFLFGVAFLAIGFYIGQQLPNWFPGLAEAWYSWRGINVHV
jgi:hypothetical protein